MSKRPAGGAVFVMIVLLVSGGATPAPPQAVETPADLAVLLERAASYCLRLESSIVDFVCREQVDQEIDPSLDGSRLSPPPVVDWPASHHGSPAMAVQRRVTSLTSSVYDYQYVRAGGRIRERRILLEENGKKKNVPDPPLKLSSLVYRNALLGPVNLFAERNQKQYVFRGVGRTVLEKRPVTVVEATPRAGAADPPCLTGKAWVDPLTGDILKIEWTQKPSANLEAFEERARQAKGVLRLTVRTEFSKEKNGLRFPSRLWIQEAYVRTSGRAFVRSKTDVVYKDFKFFTVETEVRSGGSGGARSSR